MSWIAAACLWLLFVNTFKTHELWMMIFSATATTVAMKSLRRSHLGRFSPKLGWFLQVWREPWYVAQGCASVLWTVIKQLAHPEPSVLREVVYDGGASDPVSSARRALTVLYTTLPPNFIVIDIDIERNVMLIHQVTRSETPKITRILGAKS